MTEGESWPLVLAFNFHLAKSFKAQLSCFVTLLRTPGLIRNSQGKPIFFKEGGHMRLEVVPFVYAYGLANHAHRLWLQTKL